MVMHPQEVSPQQPRLILNQLNDARCHSAWKRNCSGPQGSGSVVDKTKEDVIVATKVAFCVFFLTMLGGILRTNKYVVK